MHSLRPALALLFSFCASCAGVDSGSGGHQRGLPASTRTSHPVIPATTPADARAAPPDVGASAPTNGIVSPSVRPSPVVSMSVTPHHAVVAGTTGTLDLMIRLVGGGQAGARPELDLAIVLDRSGSMAGDKLISAQRAAMGVINALGASDHVSFLTYGTDVVLHGRRRATNVMGKEAFRIRVHQVEAGGATALGPALFESLGLLHQAERSGDVLAHVLLLSDGRANQGESDPQVLATWARSAFGAGVGTSTFGVGLDYNEDLLTKLSDAGGGRYHFIEDAQAKSDVLADELAGLTSTIARRVVLQLRPPAGVEIEHVYGYETHRRGTQVSVLVGALSARQSRAILVRVHYTATRARALALGEVRLRMTDARAGTPAQTSQWPTVPVVSSPHHIPETTNIEVAVRAAELAASERLRMAARALEAERFDEAQRTLRVAISELRSQNEASPAAILGDELEGLEHALVDVREARGSRSMNRRAQKRFKSRAYATAKR